MVAALEAQRPAWLGGPWDEAREADRARAWLLADDPDVIFHVPIQACKEDHRHDALRPGRPAPDRPEGAGERDHVRAVRRGHVHDAQELARSRRRERACASRTTSSSGSRSSCACGSTGPRGAPGDARDVDADHPGVGRRAHAARDRHDRQREGGPHDGRGARRGRPALAPAS